MLIYNLEITENLLDELIDNQHSTQPLIQQLIGQMKIADNQDSYRVCNVCDRLTRTGYLIADEEVYCSAYCLLQVMDEETYERVYQADFAFWTEWR